MLSSFRALRNSVFCQLLFVIFLILLNANMFIDVGLVVINSQFDMHLKLLILENLMMMTTTMTAMNDFSMKWS